MALGVMAAPVLLHCNNRTSVLFGLLQPGADCYNPDTPDRVDSELALSPADC